MSLSRFLISGLVLGLSCAFARAQEPAAKRYTLAECLALAQRQQIGVVTGEEAVRMAQAREGQATSARYPTLTLSAGERLIGSTANERSERDGVSVGAAQTLYSSGVIERTIERTRFERSESEAALVRTRQTATFTVTRAYFELLRAQQLERVAKSRQRLLEEQKTIVAARIAAGMAPAMDVLPLEAQLANAKVAWLTAANTVRRSTIELQSAMGLSPEEAFLIADVPTEPAVAVPPPARCLAAALATRPEVTERARAVDAAHSSLRLAAIARRPVLRITAEVEQGLTPDSNSTIALVGALDLAHNTGGGQAATEAEAQARLATVRAQAAQLAKTIVADVKEALLDLSNARDRREASAVSVTVASRNLEIQQLRYKQGLGVPLDLLNAQVEVATAESNQVQAAYDWLLALARLEYALGQPVAAVSAP
jgi:outer membrane protein